jgi:uncharacterized protein
LQESAHRAGAVAMSIADELAKLKKLHDDGTITDEQYERACAKVLADERDAAPETGEEKKEEKKPGPADEDHPRKKRRDEDERDEEDDREERRPRRRRDWDDDDDDDYYDDRHRLRRRKQVREWCMILHLSLLAGHLVVLGGVIAPIVLWQVKKEEFPEIDVHGKNAVNWLITWVIYMALSVVLAFVVIGIPLLIIGGIAGIVFPIIAGLKANEGKVWKYPLAIQFLK